MKLRLLALAAAAALAPFVHAQDAKETPAPAAAATETPAKLPKLPWHMTNIWWNTTGEIADFATFSIDVDISTDIPAEKYNLYISPFGGMSINGNSVYGGIQTNCNGWDAMAPGDKKRLNGGHGFIFSRWNDAMSLSLDDVRSTPGGLVETAGYEGHFASTRRPYAWTAGKYTYSLRRLDTQITDGKPYTWVGAFVHEHRTGRDIFVGSLRFPGDKLVNSGRNAAFMEFYATAQHHTPPVLAELPPLVVKFSNLRYNGEPADLAKASVRFIRKDEKRKDGLSAPISPNLLHVKSSEDGREITCTLVNKPFPDSEEPSRTLWEKPKAAPAPAAK